MWDRQTEMYPKLDNRLPLRKTAVFWVVAPCSLVEIYQRFRGRALMMEAARTSETLVNFYQTTRRYNPEDSHLRTHRRENLKSYTVFHLDLHISETSEQN
jgi:hypothetical protein